MDGQGDIASLPVGLTNVVKLDQVDALTSLQTYSDYHFVGKNCVGSYLGEETLSEVLHAQDVAKHLVFGVQFRHPHKFLDV